VIRCDNATFCLQERLFPKMQRIPVLAEDHSVRFWMKFTDALDAIRRKKAEEVYDAAGKFLGLLLTTTSLPIFYDARGAVTAGTFDEAWKIKPSGCIPVWQLQTA